MRLPEGLSPPVLDTMGLCARAAQYAALVRYESSPALTLIMELRAALAATMVGSTPPALSWQPIATAPKDEPFLVCWARDADGPPQVEMVAGWDEYRECRSYGEPEAYGWHRLPRAITGPLPSPPVGEPTHQTNDDVLTRAVRTDVDRPPQHASTYRKV